MFFQHSSVMYLTDFFKAGAADGLFLNSFKKMDLSAKINKIRELITANQFQFIIKMACVDAGVFEVCSCVELEKEWVSCWSTYGVILTNDVEKALYDQAGMHNKFNLFAGMYFYQYALKIASSFNNNNNNNNDDEFLYELNYLKYAIGFHSIHACQRYHRYLYKTLDHDPENIDGDREFVKIICQIKDLLPIYGAYAYVMLVEAYIRYAGYLNSNGHVDLALEAFSSALLSCSIAKDQYDNDKTSIYNASLGGTIAASNTFGLDNFDAIMDFIQARIDAVTETSLPRPETGSFSI